MDIVGTNIISALGFTTEENFENVKSGISGLKKYDKEHFSVLEPFMASLIDRNRLDDEFNQLLCSSFSKKQDFAKELTQPEKASILSVAYSNCQAKIDLTSDRTIFIISTTKGNVHLLATNPQSNKIFLWHSAQQIAHFFDNPNRPIVVSNACISGVAAQIVAMRELRSGLFDNAVVIGVDFLSKFIVSGFMSFKALSPEPCKSFDRERVGLNLGEASATIILQQKKNNQNGKLHIETGAICNDATHISAPSRHGEGYFRVLEKIFLSNINVNKEDIAFINTHGTATPYNDSMETTAIVKAGLKDVPANSLKGYFGHTLGAAGVVETIISAEALRRGLILPTLNVDKLELINIEGDMLSLNIIKKTTITEKKYIIKTLSGFGGVNAAILLKSNT